MFWLKACPRCLGDLHEERDLYGPYVVCIQCGCILTSEEEQRLMPPEPWNRRGQPGRKVA
jgi:hypothetical protein